MSEKSMMAFNGNVTASAAATYLEALAAGLRKGHVSLRAGDESVDLDANDDLMLEIEAKSPGDKGKASIELQLSWRIMSRRANEAPALLISSDSVAPRDRLGEDGAGASQEGAGSITE